MHGLRRRKSSLIRGPFELPCASLLTGRTSCGYVSFLKWAQPGGAYIWPTGATAGVQISTTDFNLARNIRGGVLASNVSRSERDRGAVSCGVMRGFE